MDRRIINAITAFFLGTYDRYDFIIQQKARVLFIITSAILLTLMPLYVFSSMVNDDINLKLTIAFVIAASGVVLFILRSGRFFLAAHSLLLLVFSAIWMTIMTDIGGNSIHERMDTIVMVVGLLAFTPLVAHRKKRVIVLYFLFNALAFAVFMVTSVLPSSLPTSTVYSYLLDTSVAILLTGVISYQVLRINTAALDRAGKAGDIIRASEELFRGVVEESPQAMIIVNGDGTLDFLSSAKATPFGYTREDIPRLDNWWELAFPDEDYRKMITDEWETMIREAAQSGPSRPIEAKMLARDGSIHDIMIRFAPLGDGGKGLILLDDITNRKIIERSLIASERRYRKLYDSMLDGFVNLDMEGRILEFNSAYRELTGYTAHELRRMTIWDLTPLQWHETQRKIIQEEVLPNGHSEVFEKEYRRKDGTLLPIELRMNLLQDDEGNNTGTWSIIHDISERKKAEDEILKTSKIESLGVFAGGIAHDFNNLLTAIMGNISIAKLDADIGSGTYGVLLEAERASMRARDLTLQLLTFSRGGAPIKKLSSIRNLLVDTADFVLSGSRIKCDFSIPENIWSVEIDEGQISQVIHNLVLNAREAMPGGGIISICAENRTIAPGDHRSLDPGNYIDIRISDTGYGIPKNDLHKIYDPFFTTKDKGNGLGLSVTYSIIKRHSGTITVETSEGRGTVFTILLPATRAVASARPERSDPHTFRPGRVLIMDDEEMVLHVAVKIMDCLGLSVVTARDGREAVEIYEGAIRSGDPFDLVIMDLTVPGGMGGKDAIAILKKIDPSVRAIVSSGYSNDPIMASFRDYGFMGVVAKPYSIEDLQEVIEKVWE